MGFQCSGSMKAWKNGRRELGDWECWSAKTGQMK
jgi:hypothetical protein